MNRQARRAELRDIEKKTKWLWKHTNLVKIMKSKPFNELKTEDIELLDKGEYADKALQGQYNEVKDVLRELTNLRNRSVFLRSKKEEDVTAVNED